MRRSIGFWQFIGFVFTSVCGTILHFLYDLSGQNLVLALFSGVNESIWEHMKLLFFPMLVFAVVEYYLFGTTRKDFWFIKAVGIVVATALIPVSYYTYSGVFGISSDIVNITIFYLTAAFGYTLQARLFQKKRICTFSMPAVAVLITVAVVFAVFTFFPPSLPLFADPITGGYGIFS